MSAKFHISYSIQLIAIEPIWMYWLATLQISILWWEISTFIHIFALIKEYICYCSCILCLLFCCSFCRVLVASLWRKLAKRRFLVYMMNPWLLDSVTWLWRGWGITWLIRGCRFASWFSYCDIWFWALHLLTKVMNCWK